MDDFMTETINPPIREARLKPPYVPMRKEHPVMRGERNKVTLELLEEAVESIDRAVLMGRYPSRAQAVRDILTERRLSKL